MVKQNQKNIMKITKKKGFKNKSRTNEIVTGIFWKKENTQKKNMEELDIRICPTRINKN